MLKKIAGRSHWIAKPGLSKYWVENINLQSLVFIDIRIDQTQILFRSIISFWNKSPSRDNIVVGGELKTDIKYKKYPNFEKFSYFSSSLVSQVWLKITFVSQKLINQPYA